MIKRMKPAICLVAMILVLSACAGGVKPGETQPGAPAVHEENNEAPPSKPGSNTGQSSGDENQSSGQHTPEDIATVGNASSITVLVNKLNKLPEDYTPADLVYPNVKFTFKEKIEKRMMVKEAADALEKLFGAADQDGLPLAGVSAYRPHSRQAELFQSYVKKDGLETALTYSAYPGTSEHETGLAIDVAGADGACSTSDCFGDRPEAKWLADHAHEYGFIIRYPEGKEKITGYKYEPWHLRYVGLDVATEIYEKQLTFEEYNGTGRVVAAN